MFSSYQSYDLTSVDVDPGSETSHTGAPRVGRASVHAAHANHSSHSAHNHSTAQRVYESGQRRSPTPPSSSLSSFGSSSSSRTVTTSRLAQPSPSLLSQPQQQNQNFSSGSTNASSGVRSPFGIDRAADHIMVQEWLLENRFDPQTAEALNGYTALELFEVTKEDLKTLVGPKDGIRLYTKLKQIKEILGPELSPQEISQVKCQAASLIGQTSPARSTGRTPRRTRQMSYGSMQNFDPDEESSYTSDIDDQYQPMTPLIAASQGVSSVFKLPYSFMPDLNLSPHPSPSSESTCSRYSNSQASQLLPAGRRGVGACCVPLCGRRVFGRCAASECGQSVCLEHCYKEIITGYVYCPECYDVYAPLNVASRKLKSTCNIQ